jgi:hypothetical protein
MKRRVTSCTSNGTVPYLLRVVGSILSKRTFKSSSYVTTCYSKRWLLPTDFIFTILWGDIGTGTFLTVLRIRDVYPGSRIRLFSILDSGSEFFHPGSRIRIKEFKYFNPQKMVSML